MGERVEAVHASTGSARTASTRSIANLSFFLEWPFDKAFNPEPFDCAQESRSRRGRANG